MFDEDEDAKKEKYNISNVMMSPQNLSKNERKKKETARVIASQKKIIYLYIYIYMYVYTYIFKS